MSSKRLYSRERRSSNWLLAKAMQKSGYSTKAQQNESTKTQTSRTRSVPRKLDEKVKHPNPLHSAVLLKEIDTYRKIILPDCRRWHQSNWKQPLAPSTKKKCKNRNRSQRFFLSVGCMVQQRWSAFSSLYATSLVLWIETIIHKFYDHELACSTMVKKNKRCFCNILAGRSS